MKSSNHSFIHDLNSLKVLNLADCLNLRYFGLRKAKKWLKKGPFSRLLWQPMNNFLKKTNFGSVPFIHFFSYKYHSYHQNTTFVYPFRQKVVFVEY